MSNNERGSHKCCPGEEYNFDKQTPYQQLQCTPDREVANSSPVSSSPPRDFDVDIEAQYFPLFDENENDQELASHRSSSLATSSLSIESEHDYPTSPVLLTANTCRVIRCPACEKPMRTFYCARCIQNGVFITIDQEMNDKFSETRLKTDSDLSPLPPPCTSMDNIASSNAEQVLENMLQIKLRTLTRKTETLKTIYNNHKLRLEMTKQLLEDTKQQVEAEKKSHRSKESKIELIKRYINSRKASVIKRQNAKANYLDELKQHINRRVYQLIQDVFTIEEVNLLEQNSSFVNMETSPLLTFSDGSHHQIEQQTAYSIVEPWLPSNGDYSAYSLWINDNKDQIPAPVNDDLSERNPAYRIGAGLAYSAQLVRNLASYLDVILPVRMEHDIFSRDLLDDSQFSYDVAKLNTNVLHLCLSQGIDISLLNPYRTLKNLMFLFNINISDIGRKPIIEIDNEEAANKIEEELSRDLSLIKEDFYDLNKFAEDNDDDGMSDSEWEMSDSINPLEMIQHQPSISNEQSMQQNSYISRLPLRLIASFWSAASN